MTTVSLQEFRLHPDKYLAATANGDVVLTQDGEPWVVLRAVDEDQDRLSAAYANSPEFRRIIQQRRKEQAIRWAEANKQLTTKSMPRAVFGGTVSRAMVGALATSERDIGLGFP